MQKTKIAFSPLSLKENKYVQIMKSFIQLSGYNVVSIKEAFSNKSFFFDTKIIHLNWFEALDGRNTFYVIIDFTKKIFILLFFKLFNKKILWVLHNKSQHDKSFNFLQRILINVLVTFSDKIIIHSLVSKEFLIKKFPNKNKLSSKLVHIPHPDYIGDYGLVVYKNVINNNSTLKLLFLGMVRPYKNLELLLDVVKSFSVEDVDLHIVGNYVSEGYRDKILNNCANSVNISTDLRFIPDNEISEILSDYDLLVFPYDISSSLNSGSVIMSFSYKKSVICPLIGTLQDYENLDNVFTYIYNSEETHYTELQNQIKKAIKIKQDKGIDVFKNMGDMMYQQVLSVNSKNKIQKKIEELYKDLLD